MISINDKVYRPLQKCFEKSLPNSTIRPSNLIYCGWFFFLINEKWFFFFFYNQHISKVTPHFTFKTQIPMHTNSIGCPNIFSLSTPVLYWLSHLTCISSLNAEKRAKNVPFHTTKNIQIQSTLFRYFQTNSQKLTSDLFTVVLPTLTPTADNSVHGIVSGQRSAVVYILIGLHQSAAPKGPDPLLDSVVGPGRMSYAVRDFIGQLPQQLIQSSD